MKDKSQPKIDARQLIEQMAGAEQAFLARPFLAPSVRGGKVRVKIGDAMCTIRTAPEDFEGFGVFEPLSFNEAILIRQASLVETKEYLRLFPRIRLIACRRGRGGWLACTANSGDARFKIDGLVPVRLAVEVQQFDILTCRFDGSQFWFEEIDMRSNLSHAKQLREALEQRAAPDQIEVSGLSGDHRAAYDYCYWMLVNPPPARRSRSTHHSSDQPTPLDQDSPAANRLRDSLSHAGGRLISYLERHDSYQVTYQVDGQNYTSAIDKDNLTVFSAGICLADEDRNFDLTSLVGVLREGQQTGQIDHD